MAWDQRFLLQQPLVDEHACVAVLQLARDLERIPISFCRSMTMYEATPPAKAAQNGYHTVYPPSMT
jgi:hypothetical protein